MGNPQLRGCNIENGGICIQQEGRGNYSSKLEKKRKFKTKKLSKTTILDEQEPSAQSVDRTKAVLVWSWGIKYSPKSGNWPSQHLKINSLCHARENSF